MPSFSRSSLRTIANAAPLLLPVLALPLTLAACGPAAPPPPPPPEVGVVTIGLADAPLASELPGRIAAVETSEVRPQISGIVEKRLFTEGAMVAKGQVLYLIADAPYRAALGSAEGNAATAQAAIRSTQLQAERFHRLAAVKGVSQQEIDNADAAAGEARATVQARRADVRAAAVNLGFTRVRAPISGRIGRSLVTVGALAQTGQADPLATIQRTDQVYVDLTQSAADLLDLRQALRDGKLARTGADVATVELMLPNGRTYPIRGKLQFSEVSVDPSSGSVTLRATFANPDGLLLPGMYVRARILEGVRRQVVLAPQQGVTRDEQGHATALVVGAGNKVEPRVLVTERALGDKWLVTSGLKPGDRLIVEGLVNLRPGTVVVPKAPQQVTAPGAPAAPAAK